MSHYKKIVRNAAAAVLTLSLATGIASAAFGSGTVTASALRLRSGASTSTATLTTAPKGTTVTVLEDIQNGWYKVDYNGQVGYMSADYLDVVPDENTEDSAPAEEAELSTEEAAAEEAVEEAETVLARVTASLLNVRSGAGTSYSRISQFSCGTIVTVLEQLDGWSKVTYGSVTGYVSNDYLTIVDADALAAAASTAAQLVELAKQYLGVRYRYGGSSPSGFDCSGFTLYVYKQFGYSLTHTATGQLSYGTAVSKSELQPGDLVFFRDPSISSKAASHVGIYIGNGQFIHASSSSSGSGVKISSLSETYYAKYYTAARRILA